MLYDLKFEEEEKTKMLIKYNRDGKKAIAYASH